MTLKKLRACYQPPSERKDYLLTTAFTVLGLLFTGYCIFAMVVKHIHD